MPTPPTRDWYTPSNRWYWIAQITIYVFAAGLVADLVQVLNLSVLETYFRTLPGSALYTLKFSSMQWALLMLTTLKYAVPIVLLLAIVFRRQWGCSVLWFIVACVLWLASVFVVIGLGKLYAESGSALGQRDNFFSDPLYCCAPEVYSNLANNCPNTGACACPADPLVPCPRIPMSVGELSPRQDAVARFWVDFVYMLYHSAALVFLAYQLAQWKWSSRSRRVAEEEEALIPEAASAPEEKDLLVDRRFLAKPVAAIAREVASPKMTKDE